MKKILFLIPFLLFTLSEAKMFQSVLENQAILVQSGKDARYCSECGMDLVKFYKTSHSAKVDGKIKQFCSIHCLAKAMQSGKKVSDIKVVDAKTLKFIDAKKAYYVVASKKKGTMSRISKYAFGNKEDALAFSRQFGGKVMSFSEALKVAQKDFKNKHMMMHHHKH